MTYAWQNGSTGATFLVSTAAAYSVTVTNAAGCTDTDAINVGYAVPGSIDLGNDTAFCAGGSALLDATLPGSTYTWSTGATTATLSAITTGTYWVEALQGNCAVSDTISITVNANPSVQLPNDTTLCVGESLLLDASLPGVSYLWQDGSTAPTFAASVQGLYSVTVTNATGCVGADDIAINFVSPNGLDLGPDTTICPGTTVTLSAAIPGASYFWSTGATTAGIQVSSAGNYWLQAGAPGCMDHDTIAVSIVPLQPPALGPDVTACVGDTLLFSVNAGQADVLWSDGSSGSSITAASGGTISVQLTLDGCIASDEVNITFVPVIDSLDLGPDIVHCPGEPLELTAPISGASYDWSTGQTTEVITVLQPGIYWLSMEDACVSASDTIVVTPGNCTLFIHVPNSFTPEGDGTNDVFSPVVSGDLISYSFTVFDRWGEAVWASAEPTQAWDGTRGGLLAPDGVYVWQLAYKANTPEGIKQERLKGHVTLLR